MTNLKRNINSDVYTSVSEVLIVKVKRMNGKIEAWCYSKNCPVVLTIHCWWEREDEPLEGKVVDCSLKKECHRQKCCLGLFGKQSIQVQSSTSRTYYGFKTCYDAH